MAYRKRSPIVEPEECVKCHAIIFGTRHGHDMLCSLYLKKPALVEDTHWVYKELKGTIEQEPKTRRKGR